MGVAGVVYSVVFINYCLISMYVLLVFLWLGALCNQIQRGVGDGWCRGVGVYLGGKCMGMGVDL